jgi:glycerate-2-kinase
VRTVVIAGPEHLRGAAVALAAQAGFAGAGTEKPAAGQDVEQLAKHIAHTAHASRDRAKKAGAKPHVFVWVREPSVVVTGDGSGGRNGHLALLVAREIAGMAGVSFLSAGSDGVDGTTKAAGAIVDGGTWNRALEAGLDPAARLSNFDSGPLHEKLGTAVATGRTGTNFMDLQILAIE